MADKRPHGWEESCRENKKNGQNARESVLMLWPASEMKRQKRRLKTNEKR